MPKKPFERKRIIVFGFEGKNNKTESNYFSHFKPKDNRFIIKSFSCGVTDPKNMVKSAIVKRRDYDYNPKEDLTFIFMDCDGDIKKSRLIDSLQEKQKEDLVIIKSNPCFELWFLNHFVVSSKEYKNSDELIKELEAFIPFYKKNKDYYDILKTKTSIAIKNSFNQIKNKNCKSFSTVYKIIGTFIVSKD